ncbi:MAG: GMC family oxidoreductase [Planctomycetota bacterium]
MGNDARFDVVILGTGAGGGTLLHALAPTGKRILVLERGGFLPREKENWDSRAVFRDLRYTAHERWLDENGEPFRPETHYFVGGNTKLYGSALLRFRERDFQEQRHYGGISPAWPVGYDEFEPYYTQAEALYHVHGQSGIDPIEPRRSAPYPWPAVTHEPRIQALYDDIVALGHRPFPLPVGVILDEKRPEHSPCIRCETCDGFPCLAHAKADAEVLCVRPAMQRDNVTLITGAYAKELLVSPSGREVTGVVAEVDGERREFRADLVVVACGAINSAALLLRSRSDACPRGVANAHDMVGRHYMRHNNSAFVALSTVHNPSRFQKTLALNDFYFGADDSQLPLGHIQTMGKADAAKFAVASPMPLPQFFLRQLASHSLDFWVTTEDLPDPNNRIQVEADGTIRTTYKENNLEAHDRLNRKLIGILKRIGRKRGPLPLTLCMRKKIPIKGTTHQCGTLRFGDDPKTSVLDRNCKAHGVDNLYVVDASFMPSSAAMNPALTIFANALRVGEHLRGRLG